MTNKMANQQMRYMNMRWNLPYTLTHTCIFGMTGCLDEDTEIYISIDGKCHKKKLKELPDKFNVISFNFDTNKKEIKQANKFNSGFKDCYEIELEDGKRVIATKDHKFFDNIGKEILVKDFVIGDSMFIGPNTNGIIGSNNVSNKECVKKKISLGVKQSRKIKPIFHSKETKEKISNSVKRNKKWQENTIRMRGNTFENMYGKKKAIKLKKIMSKCAKGKNNPSFGIPRYPKLYLPVGFNHKVRSTWEEQICRLLLSSNMPYQYEPTTFKVNVAGDMYTYTPDLFVAPNIYIEVKGPLFYHQLDKMKAFKSQYPDIKFMMITSQQNIDSFDLSFVDNLVVFETINKEVLFNAIVKNKIH